MNNQATVARPVLVHVYKEQRTTSGPVKAPIKYVLSPSVRLIKNGRTEFAFFKDNTGMSADLLIPKEGLKLDKSNEIDAHNLSLLMIRQQSDSFLAKMMIIRDEEVDAKNRITVNKESVKARAAILYLYDTPGGFAKIVDIVRELRGDVPIGTEAQVVDLATSVAEQDPGAFFDLLRKGNLTGLSILNQMVESGEAVVSPAGAVRSASGEVLGESRQAAARALKENPPATGDLQGVQIIPDETDVSPEDQVQSILQAEVDRGDPLVLSPEQIEVVVDAAMASNWIVERGGNQKYRIVGVDDKYNRTRESVLGFYFDNVAQAASLKNELIMKGLMDSNV